MKKKKKIHSAIIGLLIGAFGPFKVIVGRYVLTRGFPGGASGKEPTCQWRRCWRHRFDSRVGKIP